MRKGKRSFFSELLISFLLFLCIPIITIMLILWQSNRIVKEQVLDIEDKIIEENTGRYLWEISPEHSVCKKLSGTEDVSALQVEIATLTEFVFGKGEIKGLERVKVLSKICINEAV